MLGRTSRYFLKARNYKLFSTYNLNVASSELFHDHYRSRKCKTTPIIVFQRRHSTISSFQTWYQDCFRRITESDIVDTVKTGLVSVHDFTGLPWGVTIILTTLGLRAFITFPIGVYQSYILARLELIKVEFQGIVDELKKETAFAMKKFNWSQKEARTVYNISLKKQWRLLIERDNCHPLKTGLVVWIQLPAWILLSLSLRCMAFKYGQDPVVSELIAEQLSREGIAWVSNLLVPDSTLILPGVVSLTNLAIIELQSATRLKQTRVQKILTNLFRGLAIVSFPIAVSVPSCMSLYWATSSVLALSQNVLLMSPIVKDRLGIPRTPNHQEKPFRSAWENYKFKWSSACLIFIRNPFTNKGQRYWVIRCLRDFTQKRNKRNIDIDEKLSQVDNIWEYAKEESHTLDKLRWSTLGYHHDWNTKIYSEENRTEFPPDLNCLAQHFAKALGYSNFNAQAAIVNFYHPGTSLSGHVDHSEQDLHAPLLSFSFGQSAIFLIGGTTLEQVATPLLLQSGDVLLMTKEARMCYHAVPRILPASVSPWNEDNVDECLEVPDSFDFKLINDLESKQFWNDYDKYVSRSRINMNVRQVLPHGQYRLT